MITKESNNELLLEAEGIRKLAVLFHAVDHPLRLAMLQLIHRHQAVSVMEISDKMRLGKEAASQQLAVLRRAGLVHSTPHSRFRYYALNYKLLQQLQFTPDF